jgi:branched-chain amino acid aminotransferase
VDAVLSRAGNPESYIRIMMTRGVGDVSYHFDRVQGPTRVVIVKPYEPLPEQCYREGVAVIVASVRRNSPRALDPAIKSGNLINNILAVREAQAAGAFRAHPAERRGRGGGGRRVERLRGQGRRGPHPAARRRDPARSDPAAPARDRRRPRHSHARETVRVEDLRGADEAFITSTLKEAVPVRAVDGKPVGDGRPGPVTLRLLQAFRDYAAGPRA